MTGVSREYYPKYIFKGLQAPAVESSGDMVDPTISTTLIDMYDNFSWQIGYQMADMVIPVNAKGFETVIYEFFFMNTEYSEELIEEGTQALLDWLTALDVDALTLADEATVTQMNTNYNMLTDGQRAFVAQYADKLAQAVARIAELKGETPDDDPPQPEQPEEGGADLGLIIGLSAAGVVIVAAAVVAALLLIRRRKNAAAQEAPSQDEEPAQTDGDADNADDEGKED